ncbi:hypothetical protein Q4S45_19600 [Massilia sp. R2A-15]|uniref:hypothetical protein n=1 Tax=Massilia sp. R2A-15 TaxID=3064278 RepID=UPI002735AF76|nr:hypothetical protein [Massilia sp. R2A-15]WLI88884.1 hypothetical protein Q4S45_19600 [Massilia sp. R2A-15]
MLKITVSILVAASLAACGGGGSAKEQALPKSLVAPLTPVATSALSAESTAVPPATVQAPPVSATAPTFTGANINLNSNHQEFLVKSVGTSALQLTGTSNAGWIADGQKMDSVAINGTLNTIVFRPGATATSLTINAAGNTIYLPAGSPIKVDGAFAAQTIVHFYTPQ